MCAVGGGGGGEGVGKVGGVIFFISLTHVMF